VADKRKRVESYREMQNAIEQGMSIQELTDHVFRALEHEQLYILSHSEVTPYIKERMDNILQLKNP